MAGSARYTAILDANVLYPQLIGDTLLSLAVEFPWHPPLVMEQDPLDEGYKAMAADAQYEAQASEWIASRLSYLVS